jgi:hypothetical protein
MIFRTSRSESEVGHHKLRDISADQSSAWCFCGIPRLVNTVEVEGEAPPDLPTKMITLTS